MIATRKRTAFGDRGYEPTPKDIRRACEEIQATWSPRERARRNRESPVAWWTPPTIRLSDVVEAINAQRADTLPYSGAAATGMGREPQATGRENDS
ncbi:MAG: hypothetical protein ACQESR_30395 [Planctomycetota bacterium]